MGDPAGIGAEIVSKAFDTDNIRENGQLLCIGDVRTMRRAVRLIGAELAVRPLARLEDARFQTGTLEVLDLGDADLGEIRLGEIQAPAGQAAFEYIVRAIDLALAGSVSAIVTGPISKEAMHLAGHTFDGHAQILAERTHSNDVTMMLASGDFRVTHVSTHVSLRDAVDRCKKERILSVIRLTHEGLHMLGIEHPRLAVAGLNPHSGEGGIFGAEEINEIQPAIDEAREAGIQVYESPVPPDTVFVRMQAGKEFDAVVAQYHDQGHIPAKLLDFWGGVNITLGIPIIRTSVDHGTAFDIAGKGRANPTSLIKAIEYASRMYRSCREMQASCGA